MPSPRPYLAFELDALPAAAMAATALGIKPGDVAWGLLQLWQWCWRQKKEVVSDTAVQLAFGPDARVGQVLAEAGFLEALPDGSWRVRGAGRYLRVSEKRSAAGKARAAKAKRDGAGHMLADVLDDEDTNASKSPAPGQQTTSTPPALSANSEQRRSSSKEEGARAPASGKEKKPREPSRQERFAGYFAKRRSATLGTGCVADKQLACSLLNKELAWVLGTDPSLVTEAVELYLADPARRAQDPPCSLLWFSKDRATYLSKAQRNGAAA